jgi:hypothetical protein
VRAQREQASNAQAVHCVQDAADSVRADGGGPTAFTEHAEHSVAAGNDLPDRSLISNIAGCRFQYSLSFISALMSRRRNKQLPTRHLSGQKTKFRSLCDFWTPRMATSTIDKTHACDNHS